MLHTLRRHRLPVRLRSLFPRASYVGCAEISVTNATDDSRECRPNMLFAAVPGCRVNGAHFAAEAVRFGATSLLVQRPLAGISVPQCVVPDVRRCFGQLCSTLVGMPSRELSVVGVTGTNGKTTTTWLVRAILKAAGHSCGLLGTVEYNDGLSAESASLTTPDSRKLSAWLARMVDQGTTHAAMELSSHALHQNRAAGTELDAAVITNVTQDHFDYHHNFSEYLVSKAKIFEQLKSSGYVVLNLDDPGVASLLGNSANTTTFALNNSADVTAEVVHESLSGSRFVMRGFEEPVLVQTSLPGRHNISNCLAAAAAVRHLGVSVEAVAAGIESLTRVPGRMESVNAGQSFSVFVDYAHTDDALRHCLRFLRKKTRGRVICVFGAGGNRDQTKRPLLGRAAAEADLAVITSDNPRGEDPDEIIEDILRGFPPSSTGVLIETDRRRAIQRAVELAEPEDCVLVAGKGHETCQIVGLKRIPFDDVSVVREALENRLQPAGFERERLGA